MDISPNSNAADLDSCKKGSCVFGVTCSNATPTFKHKESILNQMTQFVKVLIVLALLFAVSFRRDDHLHASFLRRADNYIRVVTSISEESLRVDAFD